MKNNLKVIFLGGVGEIGKNMTALEFDDDIIIIDSGLSFPDEEMPGIDLVIPDISYLVSNKHKVRGILLTHGHEDHIGALPYVLAELNVPAYGTKLTLTLAENKIKEHKVNDYNLICVKPKDTVKLGCFSVEFINVNHSIAGALALAVTTPCGVVFHTGDFKIDLTPIKNEHMDLTRIAEIGRRGVLLMLGESTNVERGGYTMSERVVGEMLDSIFAENAGKRLIIATFASNVHRISQILDLAVKYKRKATFSGRSMVNVAEAAAKIGELVIPNNVLVDIEKIQNIADGNLVVISTGSQGEPMSALTRMADGEFNRVKIDKNDTVIISASAIPGNEKSIYRVINNLSRRGADVIYEEIENIHVSGHACREELKLIYALVNPKFFIPVHGEYRHLKLHSRLVQSMGHNVNNIIIPEIGNSVELTNKTMKSGENVPAGYRIVDGFGIDGSESEMLRDRRHLSEEGLIAVMLVVNGNSGEIITGPELIDKGVTLSGDNRQILTDARALLIQTIDRLDIKADADFMGLKSAIIKTLKNYIFKRTKKNPLIMPAIVKV